MSQRRQFSPAQRQILGANLVEARTKAGIKTATEAARRADITLPRLSLWEGGQITPELRGLLELAVLYRCPLESFLSGVDERFDEIIESGFPLDARRHYDAKVTAATYRIATALEAAIGSPGHERAPTTRADASTTGRGKSSSTRARRVRGK